MEKKNLNFLIDKVKEKYLINYIYDYLKCEINDCELFNCKIEKKIFKNKYEIYNHKNNYIKIIYLNEVFGNKTYEYKKIINLEITSDYIMFKDKSDGRTIRINKTLFFHNYYSI